MSIKEALVRQSVDDRVMIGDIVKKALNGKFGEVLRALVNGLTTECLEYNQVNPTDRMPLSAERLLGRMEAYHNIIYKLEAAISDSESLQLPEEQDDGET